VRGARSPAAKHFDAIYSVKQLDKIHIDVLCTRISLHTEFSHWCAIFSASTLFCWLPRLFAATVPPASSQESVASHSLLQIHSNCKCHKYRILLPNELKNAKLQLQTYRYVQFQHFERSLMLLLLFLPH